MKMKIATGISLFGLLLATAGLSYAQHNHDEARNDGKRESGAGHKSEHGQPSPRSSAPQPSQHREARESERHEAREHERRETHQAPERRERAHQEARQERYRDDRHREHVREAERRQHDRHEHERYVAHHEAWQVHRAHHWEREHHTWHERGGYRGYRIPEDRFRMHFGRAHWFHVRDYPIVVVGGYPRFQYNGLWLSVVDPLPEYWASTWYETDDVYVDYVNDGYYLYNRRHPGVAIAVNISF